MNVQLTLFLYFSSPKSSCSVKPLQSYNAIYNYVNCVVKFRDVLYLLIN